MVLLVNTNYATFLEVKENNSITRCTTEYHFEQYGLYKFSLDNCTTSVQVPTVHADEKACDPDVFWNLIF